MPGTSVRTLLASIALLVPSFALAIDLPVNYSIDGKQIKDATAATLVTFDLYSDPACTALVHTETVALADVGGVEKVILKKVKNGSKPPKTLRLKTVLVGVTPATAHYLRVTGTGIVGVGDDCQVQASGVPGADGASGADGLACWDLNGNGTCELGTEDTDISGGCDVLDCQAAPPPVITKMMISRTQNSISFEDAAGLLHTLDLGTCSDGAVCVDPSGHIALVDALSQSGTDSTLHFNIEGSPSLTCTLYHSDDDTPRSGLYFSTDNGNGLSGIWGNSTTATFSLRREGNSAAVIDSFAGYAIVCL